MGARESKQNMKSVKSVDETVVMSLCKRLVATSKVVNKSVFLSLEVVSKANL